jgi:NTE family protein
MEESLDVLVLAGGVALGAYQAGGYAAYAAAGRRPAWLAASSIGAVNAVLIAGGPLDAACERLDAFWTRAAVDAWPGQRSHGLFRHAANWTNTLTARLLGSPSLFRLRTPLDPVRSEVPGLYDPSPLVAQLDDLVDWERVNGGEVRVTIGATDAETGEAVRFDTALGHRIGADHLLASGALLPDFAPVRIGERLLADGGLSANAPFEAVLHDEATAGADLTLFVLDLFARDGAPPLTLEGGDERRWDLLFGNQSWRRIEALAREETLRAALARLAAELPEERRADSVIATLLREARRRSVDLRYLSYRGPPDEAASQKMFDFSRASLADRREAGFDDMAAALALPPADSPGLTVRPIRR